MLQRVGFQDTGFAPQPKAPHNPDAKCLTAGGPDRKGGRALGWDSCEDLTVVTQIQNSTRMEAQAFKLNTDGTIKLKGTDLCVRRMPCKEGGILLGYIYDLGACRDDFNLIISVEKAQANNIEHMRDMGFLAEAVALEVCELCGPYRLKNLCMSNKNNDACGGRYQARPGWTKLASQYVGDAAVNGRSDYGTEVGGSTGVAHTKEQMMGIDMTGIGKTTQPNGMCGSYATDSPTLSSFFYVLKMDKVR